MTQVILQTAGGLGLFLVGMIIMTDGLKKLSAKYLHGLLTRFTHNPASGVITGATTTAILQSSSATTIATVGFVSAGLLTFPQALGIIFGANLGTTITGWIVALLGIKLKLGTIFLPVIFIGALLRLFGKPRLAAAGLALAGFGLIFVAITFMQQGLSTLEGSITPDVFPEDTIIGRLQLILLGVAITLVTQSSSAGVATALLALHAGTINFPQAAALVIGMDVGTTVKAVLATLGGSVETRRTGYSHVIYNLMTAMVAFFLLTPFVIAWESFTASSISEQGEIALVAFHSGFNLLSIFAILPFTHSFQHLIERLVPEPEITELDRLDRSSLREPEVALSSVGITLHEITQRLFNYLRLLIESAQTQPDELEQLAMILDKTQQYVDEIQVQPENQSGWKELCAAVHTLDHLQRLHERCEEEPERAAHLGNTIRIKHKRDHMLAVLDEVITLSGRNHWKRARNKAEKNADQLVKSTEKIRKKILEDIASGFLTVPDGTDNLEALRWLQRCSHHTWRVCHHLHLFKQAEK